MKIDKSKISPERALEHCMDNYILGNFRYLTEIYLHETDIDVYDSWLFDAETVDQGYFFMFIETNKPIKKLCGFSTFKIKSMFDSKAVEHPTDIMDSDHVQELASDWIKDCDCYYVSGLVRKITNAVFNGMP